MANLESFQETYEQRFGCCICLGPKLNMVSGKCQHRICDDCLYKNEERRPCMTNCPLCGLANSFPLKRPIIPLQVIEVQRCIGVQECPNKCPAQMWYWEVEDHLKFCPRTVVVPVVKESPKVIRSKRRVSDRGQVSVTSRITRQSEHKKMERRLRRRDSLR